MIQLSRWEYLGEKLNVLFFGEDGSGKRSLINTLCTDESKSETVRDLIKTGHDHEKDKEIPIFRIRYEVNEKLTLFDSRNWFDPRNNNDVEFEYLIRGGALSEYGGIENSICHRKENKIDIVIFVVNSFSQQQQHEDESDDSTVLFGEQIESFTSLVKIASENDVRVIFLLSKFDLIVPNYLKTQQIQVDNISDLIFSGKEYTYRRDLIHKSLDDPNLQVFPMISYILPEDDSPLDLILRLKQPLLHHIQNIIFETNHLQFEEYRTEKMKRHKESVTKQERIEEEITKLKSKCDFLQRENRQLKILLSENKHEIQKQNETISRIMNMKEEKDEKVSKMEVRVSQISQELKKNIRFLMDYFHQNEDDDCDDHHGKQKKTNVVEDEKEKEDVTDEFH